MVELTSIVVGWLHVFSAVVWVGGSTYFEAVIRPNLKKAKNGEIMSFVRDLQARFIPIAWVTVILLVFTGFTRIFVDGNDASVFSPKFPYGLTLTIKMTLVFIMVAITLVLTLLIRKYTSETADSSQSSSIYSRIILFERINVFLGIVIIFLAVALRYGGLF